MRAITSVATTCACTAHPLTRVNHSCVSLGSALNTSISASKWERIASISDGATDADVDVGLDADADVDVDVDADADADVSCVVLVRGVATVGVPSAVAMLTSSSEKSDVSTSCCCASRLSCCC